MKIWNYENVSLKFLIHGTCILNGCNDIFSWKFTFVILVIILKRKLWVKSTQADRVSQNPENIFQVLSKVS